MSKISEYLEDLIELRKIELGILKNMSLELSDEDLVDDSDDLDV